MHKRLVAALSRLVTCLQSNFIGTNFTGFCPNLGVRGLFSSPFVSYWVHIDWLAPGYLMGRGIPPFHGKPKPRSRLPASPSPGSPTKSSKSLSLKWELAVKLTNLFISWPICCKNNGRKFSWCFPILSCSGNLSSNTFEVC